MLNVTCRVGSATLWIEGGAMGQICALAVADIVGGGGGAPIDFVVLLEAEECFGGFDLRDALSA